MSGPSAYPSGLQAGTRPLLSTKFFAPPPRATLVARPRLIARLEQGMERPLTLISAPAGSGKTTLVSDWRATAGMDIPLAWLSIDPDDNDPSLFLAYLFTALSALQPDLSDRPTSLFLSDPQTARHSLLAHWINDLGSLPGPFVLVLDDYHLITSPEVHEAVTFLLDHRPIPMHLILLTQVDPPLPLARLRARDQLVEIRAVDLGFNASEAGAFLTHSMGLKLSRDQVAVLEERTEGWIAGMQLAALALQSRRAGDQPAEDARWADPFLKAFSGSHPYIASYLTEEVLNHQPDEVRAFLLQTSILDRMTGDLCDRVTGRHDGQAWLRRLEEASLFIVPLDEEAAGKTGGGWYRYHHLFRELLFSQLQAAGAAQVSALHHKAAGWFEQHGFAAEAIKHALAAGEQSQAARIIERNAMERLLQGDSVTVLNWIDSVSPLLGERPWLNIYQSWATLVTGEMAHVETRLKMVENWIESHHREAGSEAAALGDHLIVIRALAAGRSGRTQEAISLAKQALDSIPEQEEILRSIITFTLGDQLWSSGDLAGARVAFEAAGVDRSARGGQIGVLALSSLAMLFVEQGELQRAGQAFQAALEMNMLHDGRILPAAAVACLGLAGLAYERNDLEAAGTYVHDALELGGQWGNPDTLANARLVQARQLHALGDTEGSLQSLSQAEELARQPGVTPWSGLRIDAFRVRLWLEQGNLDAADRWARRQNLSPAGEIIYPRQAAYLALARLLIAQEQLAAAMALLERLLTQFEAGEQKGRALEAQLLRALALAAQGDIPGALADLRPALAAGEQEGYQRIFLDEGPPMAELLRHAGSQGIYPKYIARLVTEFHQAPGAVQAASQPLIEPLTGRELEVLSLIADGLSNEAIAARLVVALGTVKAHTASLYRKLDVTSRTQAAARARELELL